MSGLLKGSRKETGRKPWLWLPHPPSEGIIIATAFRSQREVTEASSQVDSHKRSEREACGRGGRQAGHIDFSSQLRTQESSGSLALSLPPSKLMQSLLVKVVALSNRLKGSQAAEQVWCRVLERQQGCQPTPESRARPEGGPGSRMADTQCLQPLHLFLFLYTPVPGSSWL